MADLGRLLRPRSIAVIGGGVWCGNVVRELDKIGFDGPVWRVHPRLEGAFRDVADLPEPPDAAFVGVNRETTVEVIRALSTMGAGGAVCFASGFREAEAELQGAGALQAALQAAAGDMPFLGPNCYGFVNALDGAALWPDQHGLRRVDSGVAILTQSSNIALNLTMQRRGLPIAYLGTVGNQARVDLAQLGMALLDDPRVTALGLYIEGITDLREFEALAAKAYATGKRIVALKLGASEQAQTAAVSHTASLAGSDAGAAALLERLGIARVASLEVLLETLKILHVTGPLQSDRLVSMSCSGGEASLMADSALAVDVAFPPLNSVQKNGLRAALGPKVALANPLDYHTYIWGDEGAMTACYSAMMDGDDLGLGLLVLDFPRSDLCDASDWDPALRAARAVAALDKAPLAVMASLPDAMPEDVAEGLVRDGVLPLCGLEVSLRAIAAAAWLGRNAPAHDPLLLPCSGGDGAQMVSEAEAKVRLAKHGLPVPRSVVVRDAQALGDAARAFTGAMVLKSLGFAHKSEAGAVQVGLTCTSEVEAAAAQMGQGPFLLEDMISGAVAEVLVGVLHDPAHGYVLTLGAGGVLTEVWQDVTHVLLPASPEQIEVALGRLRIAPVLSGWRGAPAADLQAIVQAVLAVQAYVMANAGRVEEIEINPLICLPKGAVAVDALIRERDR